MEHLPVQRRHVVTCAGCAATVTFQWAQAGVVICPYCRSTLLREVQGPAIPGQAGEMFDDHSPLQCRATGLWDSQPFDIVGRLQYRGPSGVWSEWLALLADGRCAFLVEDQGRYAITWPATLARDVPAPDALRRGLRTAIAGVVFTVTANEAVSLQAAEGELPHLPSPGSCLTRVEMRNTQGEVLCITYGSQGPLIRRGHAVALSALRLRGLRQANDREQTARHFPCPQCGAPVAVGMAQTRSLTCANCNSLIDTACGPSGEYRYAVQRDPVSPLLPLGRVGRLQGAAWQVVGYRRRVGHPPGEQDDTFEWHEHLVYSRQHGFVFLVCDDRGWHWVEPLTGAPQVSRAGQSVRFEGEEHSLQAGFFAQTQQVCGEFFWPVRCGQRTFNRRFGSGSRQLLLQESGPRQVWSLARPIATAQVAAAFRADPGAPAWAQQVPGWWERTAACVGEAIGNGWWTWLGLAMSMLALGIALSRCQVSIALDESLARQPLANPPSPFQAVSIVAPPLLVPVQASNA